MDEFVPLDTHFKDEKMSDQKALAYLAETFRSFLNGQYLPSLDLKVRDSIESCDLKELFDFVATSLSGYNKGVQAIKSISDGDLNFEITLPSPILEPVKILQAKLKHLIWQTQMIAAGDYSHHIDFIGDFSTSFNQLIHSLQKRQDLEQKLVESQRKFQLITENSNDVIWIMDVATRKFTYISPSVYKLRGLTVEEAMSETFEQSMTPESALKANQKFELLHTKIKNNQPMPDSYDEFQQWCKNGQVIDIEVSTKLIYDQNGQPKEILGLSRDITERKKAEKALMKSEEKLTQLLALQSSKNRQLISHLQYIYNNANNSIAFFDIKGDTIKFSSCNKRWANNNGFEPEDLVGFDISGMPDQETATLYRKYIQKVSETKQPLQDYIIWHNLHIHIIVIPIPDERTGEITSCGSLIYNISDKVEADLKIKETEKRFFSIFNNSKDAIVLLSLQLEIIDANESFCQLYGSNNYPKLNFLKSYFPGDNHKMILGLIKNINKGLSVPTFETVLYRHNSTLVTVEINTSVITYKQSPMLLCIIRDISEKKEMERMLTKVGTQIETRERRKLAADLHDNVGPLLSSMNMYLSVLSRKEELLPYTETMTDIRRILKDTISSVREISNNLSPQILENFGLTAALDHFFETKKRLINIQVTNNIGDIRFSEIKETMTYNVIIEAFNNSLKHSNANRVQLDIKQEKNTIHVVYSDNGIGFNLEEC